MSGAFAAEAPARAARLKWQTVDGASQYDIQISRTPDMTKLLAHKRLKETAIQVPVPPGTYYYRLRGVDVDGNPGPWSDIEAFAVNARPPEPVLPADKADFAGKLPDDGIKFTWEKGLGSSKYRVEIRDRSGPLVDRVVDGEEFYWAPMSPGVYRWRVGYDNSTGVEWGPSRVFRVQGMAVALPPEIEKKIQQMGPQNKAVDTGGESAYYLIARPGLGMAMYSADFDYNNDGNVQSDPNGGENNIGSFFNVEFRWRAARKPETQWLLSGSVNLEMMGISVSSIPFYLPSIFTRVFYTFRSPNSTVRWGPFLHLQYGSSVIAGVNSVNGTSMSGMYLGRGNRFSPGIGGAAIFQIGTSNFISLLAVLRYDFGLSGFTEYYSGTAVPGQAESTLGTELGFGILFSLSPRLIAESRVRYNYMGIKTTGTLPSHPTSVTNARASQVFIDIGLGYQL